MCLMRNTMNWWESGRERNIKLGQTVKIQVVSVDRYLKTIDFLPVRNFDKR